MHGGRDSREYHHLREKGKKEPTEEPRENTDSGECGVMEKKGAVPRNKTGVPQAARVSNR